MSQQFKGKRCAYCAEREAVTGDHIFAREFFLVFERAKSPTSTDLRWVQQQEIKAGTLLDYRAAFRRPTPNVTRKP